MKGIFTMFIGMILVISANTLHADNGEESMDELIKNVESGLSQSKTEEVEGENVIITTTTTTTSVSITTQKNIVSNDEVMEMNEEETEEVEGAVSEVEVSTKKLNITGERPLNIGNLILAESLGLLIPGSGLAHFTLGDATGGRIILACTGVSALLYLTAEVGIETRMIDDPNIYNSIRYGSIALFTAGFLFDLIHAPIYYKKHNESLNTVSYFKALEPQYTAYQWNDDSINLNVINLGLSF